MRFFPTKSTHVQDLTLAFEVNLRAARQAQLRARTAEARTHLDRALEHARDCLARPGGGALVGALLADELPALYGLRPAFDVQRVEALAVLVERATQAVLKVVVRSATGAVDAGLDGARLQGVQALCDELCDAHAHVDDVLAAGIALGRGDALAARGAIDAAVGCWLRARARFAAALGDDAFAVAKLDRKLARFDVVPMRPPDPRACATFPYTHR